MDGLANRKGPLADFSKQCAAEKMTAQNLADELYNKILQVLPKNNDWRKIQQCVQRLDETVFDYYGHLETTFLQFSGVENVKRKEISS